MEDLVNKFIETANDFNIDAALSLFSDHAIIDDVSVGEEFVNKNGVRRYLETYFIGYRTKTILESTKIIDDRTIYVKVDFTGDFGHEKGGLNFKFSQNGSIERIDAFLD